MSDEPEVDIKFIDLQLGRNWQADYYELKARAERLVKAAREAVDVNRFSCVQRAKLERALKEWE